MAHCALGNGETRPATDDDLLVLQAAAVLPLAEAKLRTYPPVKQLQKQQKMLDRRFAALLDGMAGIDKPGPDIRKQIGGRMLEVHQARSQLFDLETERGRHEQFIAFLRWIIQRARAAAE
jgi:hypothetical protein